MIIKYLQFYKIFKYFNFFFLHYIKMVQPNFELYAFIIELTKNYRLVYVKF